MARETMGKFPVRAWPWAGFKAPQRALRREHFLQSLYCVGEGDDITPAQRASRKLPLTTFPLLHLCSLRQPCLLLPIPAHLSSGPLCFTSMSPFSSTLTRGPALWTLLPSLRQLAGKVSLLQLLSLPHPKTYWWLPLTSSESTFLGRDRQRDFIQLNFVGFFFLCLQWLIFSESHWC